MSTQKEIVNYADLPEISETFVDSIGGFSLSGHDIRIELRVSRLQEPKPNEPPTYKQYPACRLVITPKAVIDLFNTLQNLMNILAQEGLVKKEELPKGTIQ